MKRKYSKKLISDYIWGNDIDGYSILELEDDYQFMIEVIKCSKDKRIYNLCSDNVKKNHEFIKFMITFFADDEEFIEKVASEYYENTPDDIDANEIAILAGSILKRGNNKITSLTLQTAIFYSLTKAEITTMLDICSEKERQTLGKGFIFIIDSFGSSKIICNFFAEHFIHEIFDEATTFTLEELLHKYFHSFEELENRGINNFFINYIRSYDYYLSEYICNHLEVLNFLKESLPRIKNNWNRFIDNLNSRKIQILYQFLFDCYSNNHLEATVDIETTLCYIRENLQLEDIFNKHDEQIDDDVIEKIKKREFTHEEILFLNKIVKFTSNLFAKDFIESTPDDYDNSSKSKDSKLRRIKRIYDKSSS